ncbi:hypothetical protein ACLOJK_041789 [Asimina triloba]
MEPCSPPRQTCCFGCSVKSTPGKKKSKKEEILGLGPGDEDWGKNEELLSDFSTFSLKEQDRRLKKALKEEEKVAQEAEKVVTWVKQASARMDYSPVQESIKDHGKLH